MYSKIELHTPNIKSLREVFYYPLCSITELKKYYLVSLNVNFEISYEIKIMIFEINTLIFFCASIKSDIRRCNILQDKKRKECAIRTRALFYRSFVAE